MGIIKKVYIKLKELNKNTAFDHSIKERLSENLIMDDSSILQEQSSFYFNPLHSRQNRKCITIGKRCLITAKFIFETGMGKVIIGDNVYMGNVTLNSRTCIDIGNNVTMAWGIFIYDHDAHSTDWLERSKDNERCYNDYINHQGNLNYSKDWSVVPSKRVKVDENVWIGFDVSILKGVTIGKGAVIAAKAVVTRDVPPWTLVAGNPARVVKELNKYD